MGICAAKPEVKKEVNKPEVRKDVINAEANLIGAHNTNPTAKPSSVCDTGTPPTSHKAINVAVPGPSTTPEPKKLAVVPQQSVGHLQTLTPREIVDQYRQDGKRIKDSIARIDEVRRLMACGPLSDPSFTISCSCKPAHVFTFCLGS